MEPEELEKYEKKIYYHRRYIQGALNEIGSVLKMKKDLEYYMQKTIALEKDLERLKNSSLSEK